MARLVIAVIGIAIVAMVGTAGLQAALEDAGRNVAVENETWTPDPGNVTQLDDSGRTGAYYDHNVTVRNSSDVEMDRGGDYEWFAGNGTVKAVTGGDLDGEPNATITYGYRQTTSEQRDLAALLGQLPRAMGLALPIGAVLVLFRFLGG